MNNVYDQAHKLARAIKDSEEYNKYMEKREIVYSDEKNKQMVEDFRNKVFEVQMDQLSGKEVEESEIEKLGKLEDVLMLNPAINDFFTAELRFSQLVQDINNIIGEAIDIQED
mgnify:CR=1 FL=1